MNKSKSKESVEKNKKDKSNSWSIVKDSKSKEIEEKNNINKSHSRSLLKEELNISKSKEKEDINIEDQMIHVEEYAMLHGTFSFRQLLEEKKGKTGHILFSLHI